MVVWKELSFTCCLIDKRLLSYMGGFDGTYMIPINTRLHDFFLKKS